jgi:hypothetical protein
MTFKLKRIEWYAVLFSAMASWAIMLQHRFISLPFCLLFIGLCLTRRWHKRDWPIVPTAAAFFLSTFSPVDLYVPGWSGPIFGNEKSGTRFVRQAMGLRGASMHVRNYGGECVEGGCIVQAFCDAKWLLVLDWSGGTNRFATGTGIPNSTTSRLFRATNSDDPHEQSNSPN